MPRRPSRARRDLTFGDLAGRRTRAYIRESTARQAEVDRFGPDLQRNGISRFCEEYGLTPPDAWYFDKAFGRSVQGRHELQRAYDEADEYEVLVFFHSSRSFRNQEDARVWKRQFREAGVVLVFVEQRLISGNSRDRLAEGLYEIFDEQQSETQGMLIGNGLRARFERGIHNGPAPLGYVRHHGEPGDPRNGNLLLDDAKAPVIEEIFRRYLTGDISIDRLTLQMSTERDDTGGRRFANRVGGPITKGLVEEVLRNEAYIGTAMWHPGTPEEEKKPDSHLALITREAFAKVEAIRRRRAKGGGVRGRRHVHPLSDPSTCHACGASFKGDTSGRKPNYRRRLRHREGIDCPNRRSFDAAKLEQAFAAVLDDRFALPARAITEVMDLLARPVATDPHAIERRRLQQAQSRLADLYLWGEFESKEDYFAQKSRIERDLAALPPTPCLVLVPDLVRAEELLRDIGTLWSHPGVTDTQRKTLANEVIDRIELDEVGIRVVVPRAEYAALVATAEVEWLGSGRGDRI